jgi:alpha-beta hydrolase superfamily lysophospholipase
VDLGFYTRAQTEVGALPVPGYRDDWRPARGFRTHPAWLAAVLEGHRRIAAGVEVGCPVLVLLSARSTMPMSWSDDMTSTDSVLVVDDIATTATRIGSLVTIARIDGALHDVLLSRSAPRALAYKRLDEWVRPALRMTHPA